MEIPNANDRRAAVRNATRGAASAPARFPLGRIFHTPGAIDGLTLADLLALVRRHQCGDWGDVCADDARANEDALRTGARVFSAYETPAGKRWVITESDRSATTILRPDEY